MSDETSKSGIFSNRRFLLLWCGEVLSQAGTRLFQIATLWMLLTGAAGGSGKRLGLFLVIAALPSLVLVKWIGRTVDRLPSRRILIVSNVLATWVCLLLLLAMRVSSSVNPWVYLAGFLLALFQAFIDPTLNKAVQELVSAEQLEPAVAMISSTQSMANFGGAVAGAVTIGMLGFGGAIAVNAVSYVASAVCCAAIRFGRGSDTAPADAAAAPSGGWAIFANRPLLRDILIGFGVVNFFGTPTLLIMPVYTKTALGFGPEHLAIFEAALWLGLLAGAAVSSRLRFDEEMLKFGGICVFLFGFFLFLPGVIVQFAAYVGALFFAGTVLGINNVKFVTLFQRVVDPSIRGSFFASMGAMISFTFPVAFLFFGVLADRIPVTRLCVLQGVGIMAVALWYLSIARREKELYA